MATKEVKVCSIENCDSLARSRGWCGSHYERWRRGVVCIPFDSPIGYSDGRRYGPIAKERPSCAICGKECPRYNRRYCSHDCRLEAGKSGADMAKASQRTKDLQRKKRVIVDGIKVWLGCMDCGYREHPAALDYDHRSGETKKFSISQGVSMHSIEKIYDEMHKCDVVCANCHRIRTYNRRWNKEHAEYQGFNSTISDYELKYGETP